MSARLNRIASFGAVLAFLAATRALWPEAASRTQLQYLLVATLGYGHLIGAAWEAMRSSSAGASGSAPIVRRLFVASSCMSLFVVYAWLLGLAPWLVLGVLAVAVWHVTENDVSLSRLRVSTRAPLRWAEQQRAVAVAFAIVCVAGQAALVEWRDLLPLSVGAPVLGAAGGVGGAVCLGLAALQRTRPKASLTLGLSGCVALGATWLGPEVYRFVSFGDVSTGAVLYHLVSWLLLVIAKLCSALRDAPAVAATRVRRLVAAHVFPALACAVAVSVGRDVSNGAMLLAFSPAIYLFWSALHVVQTGVRRGFGSAQPTRIAS
jgi:hypothetical protein